MSTNNQVRTRAQVALELLREHVRSGATARVRAFGTSMAPAIWPADELLIEPLREQPARGDVVAFERAGRLYVHRVIATAPAVLTQGDRLASPDAPVSDEEMIGVVREVLRNGRTIQVPRRLTGSAWILRQVSRITMLPVVIALKFKGLPASRADEFDLV